MNKLTPERAEEKQKAGEEMKKHGVKFVFACIIIFVAYLYFTA
jgi:hypothetical protein